MFLPSPHPNPQTLPSLREVRPSDQAHLLFWDEPTPAGLHYLTTYNNAQLHHYRDRLQQRLQPRQKFLHLHHHLPQEIADLTELCHTCQKSIVLLQGFDLLLTYLRVQPNSPLSSFWKTLDLHRKLAVPLWILLPTALQPPQWHRDRALYINPDENPD